MTFKCGVWTFCSFALTAAHPFCFDRKRERERERAVTVLYVSECSALCDFLEKCFLVFKELASYVANAMEQNTLQAYAAAWCRWFFWVTSTAASVGVQNGCS